MFMLTKSLAFIFVQRAYLWSFIKMYCKFRVLIRRDQCLSSILSVSWCQEIKKRLYFVIKSLT